MATSSAMTAWERVNIALAMAQYATMHSGTKQTVEFAMGDEFRHALAYVMFGCPWGYLLHTAETRNGSRVTFNKRKMTVTFYPWRG